MELRHLRYFVAVAEAKSFRKASAILCISQPPLSVQIKNLELELKAALFLREKKKIKLTEAGEVFLIHARSILAEADRAKASAKMAGDGKSGTLKIQFISSAVTGPLQDLVGKFKKIYPLVDIQLSQSTVEQILVDLEKDRIDAGIIREPAALPGSLNGVTILKESYYVALPASHFLRTKKVLTPADLATEGLIIYPRATASGSFDDILYIFSKQGIVPNIMQEAPEQLTIAGLVASGMGYSIVPECMTHIVIPGIIHRPLKGGRNKTGMILVTKKQANATTKNFLKLLNT
jgi:DNA-binding transcriptional LysR family regulator